MGEAVILGLTSGPACLVACGPVLLPWLAAERQGLKSTAGLLTLFLGGRLAGYMVFALLAWGAGMAVPVDARNRVLVYGLANLGLAAMLVVYACVPRNRCLSRHKAAPELLQIGAPVRMRWPATATLGLLTGLNLCPPFLAAGVRAAEARTLHGALVFMLLFFVGTAVWFLPSLAVIPVRRFAAGVTVARMTMVVLAVYYAYQAVIGLSWRFIYG